MGNLSFLAECNLTLLQSILRGFRHSCFLPTDNEIGLDQAAADAHIISKVEQQKQDLGVDRIIITPDNSFITSLGSSPVKIIILTDLSRRWNFKAMSLKLLVGEIIAKGDEMVKRSDGHDSTYIECSRFY